MSSIVVVDYDPNWPKTFDQLRGTIWSVVGNSALSIEHVGSTSVPGLAAKPIIDMDVVVASDSDVPTVIDRLATLAYSHRGNLGIEGREAFDNPPGSPAHHLYLCRQGCLALRNHLAVRDYLRANPAAAREYGALKKSLAEKYRDDIDRYIDGKTELLLGLLRRSGLSSADLEEIERANRTT